MHVIKNGYRLVTTGDKVQYGQKQFPRHEV